MCINKCISKMFSESHRLRGGRPTDKFSTPCLWGRAVGLRFGVAGAPAEPTEELAHRIAIPLVQCRLFLVVAEYMVAWKTSCNLKR